MTCSEKACVLPALPGSALCRHHAQMFSGDAAFESYGCRGMVETLSEQYKKRQTGNTSRTVKRARELYCGRRTE